MLGNKHDKLIKILLSIITILSIFSKTAAAHPVVYKDVVAVMTWNQPFLSDNWITYSFGPQTAIAARTMRMTMAHGGNFYIYAPQFNYLVKRWYGDDFQANIYVYSGFGGTKFRGRSGTAGIGGIEADAESRKYFGLIKYDGMTRSLGKSFQQVEVRLGIAPYEAEYTEIASWFMVSGKYHHGLTRNYSITPLARFFYKTFMLETGVSLQGDWMLNFMFHF